jgi:hypothetical protein
MIANDTIIAIALGGIGYILALILWFGIMPRMLDSYALTTSIEMMKNRECVDIVIKHQKF